MNPNDSDFIVDCVWGDWVNGTCSKTCGGGIRTDRRTIRQEAAGNGTCEGEPTKEEKCNPEKCPGNVNMFHYFLFIIIFIKCEITIK